MDSSVPAQFQHGFWGIILDQILNLKVESLFVYIGWTTLYEEWIAPSRF